MPYIKPEHRIELDKLGRLIGSPGELNYLITGLCEEYRRIHEDSYTTFNDIIGALECAKIEFYRRVITPYEDQKKHDNGDVYRTLDNV